ncbi:MAG: class I SAM-dependent methyltransferase [Candidatus Omnitrophica bacterium]|nr:class I SAM-dependent methyltransferase [Candidatus Omnitrophota bacterium]
MYKVLCRDHFQKYVPRDGIILDLAAGYCEFINNINARGKIAVDINPDVRRYAAPGVKAVLSSSTDMKAVDDSSIDIVFAGNFFEHLTKEDIVKTMSEIHRVLKDDGKVMILQPNIRFCYKDYWMFFDHVSPLDDRSMREALEINGFKVIECIPRFLPYTTKSMLPKSLFLLRLYIRVPLLWRIFGSQAFILAGKTQN